MGFFLGCEKSPQVAFPYSPEPAHPKAVQPSPFKPVPDGFRTHREKLSCPFGGEKRFGHYTPPFISVFILLYLFSYLETRLTSRRTEKTSASDELFGALIAVHLRCTFLWIRRNFLLPSVGPR